MFLVTALSTEEVDVWKKKYDQESFPGLEVPMEDVTAMMTAPDPGAAVGAKAISNAGEFWSEQSVCAAISR